MNDRERIRELKERIKSLERQRDEYAYAIGAMLGAVENLATGTLSGGAKALLAGSILRDLKVRK